MNPVSPSSVIAPDTDMPMYASRQIVSTIACALLLSSCVTPEPGSSLDPSVWSELQSIGDILSRPHDFPSRLGRSGGISSVRCPWDFGCVLVDEYMPNDAWRETGHTPSCDTTVVRGAAESTEPPGDIVARACWRLTELGCVGLFRSQLLAIQGDQTLSTHRRRHAIVALGSLVGDTEIVELLVHSLGDRTLALTSADVLAGMGRRAVTGIRGVWPPKGEDLCSRVIWVLSQNVVHLEAQELTWLIRQLEGPNQREALWAIRCLYLHDELAVVGALTKVLSTDAPPAAFALLAFLRDREQDLDALVLEVVHKGEGARRQLALQALGAIESPDAFELLLALTTDKTALDSDRAAAAVALSQYRLKQKVWTSTVATLLDEASVRLRRVSLYSLHSATHLSSDILAHVKTMRNDPDSEVLLHARALLH